VPEPRFKLIVLDLDGTLLGEHSRVSPRTRAALVRASEAGVAIAVATGRSYALTRYFCGDLPLTGPQISYNGAIVVDPVTAEPTFLQAVPIALVSPVVAFLAEQQVFTCYYTDDAIYVTDHSPFEIALVPPDLPQPISVPDFDRLAHLPALKIVAVAEKPRIDSLRPLAEAAFGNHLYVTRTSPVLLEFLHPAVSKGAALATIIESLGLTREQVLAFGDSHNDIGMLRVAGTGVAMGNADAEVKAAADIVAPRNTEDGIAVVLDDILWSGTPD
jgi:Cof subfamily protein (haloacid dehalogenase superfamily)